MSQQRPHQPTLDLGATASNFGSREFPATRAEGLRRLAAFVPRAGEYYARGRNADLGPDNRDAVSVLSPYLRYRLTTEYEVVEAVLARHSASAAEKFVQEVLWRTYWKGWLEMRPAVWTRFNAGREDARAQVEASSGLKRALAQAEAGMTGIEGFDDWAQELVATGYLHNHARMWFASIWIFTLKLPWELGADFFQRHLIDADPASNTLSWRWVAGLQTVGKTYLATASNIQRYTDGRFNPKGLATTATALVEPPIPKAQPIASLRSALPQGPALLLITGEDLNPESLVRSDQAIAGVVIVRTAGTDLAWPWGRHAQRFLDQAVNDTATRLQQRWHCPVETLVTLDVADVVRAARVASTSSVITPFAPVGPMADALTALGASVAVNGLVLSQLRREWDEQFWPYATKGFFGFKERIPEALASVGLRS
jgi:deoxyribodipyrimidine photo-lyase